MYIYYYIYIYCIYTYVYTMCICIYIYDIQVYLFNDGIYIAIKYTPRRSWKPNNTLDSSSLVQQNEGLMRVFVAQP
jgi:membrane associated rhomboid family serine protease